MKVRLIFGSMTYLIYFLLYMSISQNVKASLDTRLEILPVFVKEACFKGTSVFKGPVMKYFFVFINFTVRINLKTFCHYF